MAGVIKKLYHPIDNGTVTTAVSQELQEVYPITATNGVYAPEGAFHANDNLDQILRWLDANKISGSGLKTLTVNGTENSLIGSGTIVINTGGGGGGGSDSDFFELDASGNLHVKNDRGLYTGSFISAGGVGSGGGGQGGDGNATSIMGIPISFSNLSNGETIYYDSGTNRWKNANIYRTIEVKRANWDPLNPTQNIVTVLNGYYQNPLFLQEGTGVTFDVDATSGTIKINATGVGTLPIASASQLGGIRVGSGLTIDNNTGLLSVTGGSYSLPVASTTQLGGVKVGNSLTINNEVLDINETNLRNGWMDLTTAQTVQGTAQAPALKTFVDGIAIGNSAKTITLVNGEIVINGDVKVNGNLYATGNVTAGTSSN